MGREKPQAVKADRFFLGNLLVIFLLCVGIWIYVDGYVEIHRSNELKEMGFVVNAVVTDKDIEYDGFDETATYVYTLRYVYEGQEYHYERRSPDNIYDPGDELELSVDPDSPGEIFVPDSTFYVSFVVMYLAIMTMMFIPGFFSRIPYIKRISSFAVAVFMIVTGILLKQVGLIVAGVFCIFGTLLAIWLFRKLVELENRNHQRRMENV